jgi:capsular polysaccharide export protein
MHDLIHDITEHKRLALPVRNVLLLQSLTGPFFRQLGQALRRLGFGVFKVNFNGGDKLFWAFNGGAIDYTGTQADWPAALAEIIASKQITDVILFGDCRPLHRDAILLCSRLGVPVHVCDEGYIRPDWVTFELGGVNGNSRLPRDPNFYLERARCLPAPAPHQPVASSFRRRALEAVAYDAANILNLRFRHWRNHRPNGALKEGVGWLRRLRRSKRAAAATAACLGRLEAESMPYVLLPLQLDSDSQIRFHSTYTSMAEPIALVLKSFAVHAGPELRLLIKAHPLDNGLCDYRRLVEATAAAYGIAGRVAYIEGGDIALIVRAARGLVTVNSTTGTLALASGVPVLTLGYAVYDMPGITSQTGLDAFWNNPGQPDAGTFEAFRRVLIDRCLVAGGFFSADAMRKLVDGVVMRLIAHDAQLALANRDGILERPAFHNLGAEHLALSA